MVVNGIGDICVGIWKAFLCDQLHYDNCMIIVTYVSLTPYTVYYYKISSTNIVNISFKTLTDKNITTLILYWGYLYKVNQW